MLKLMSCKQFYKLYRDDIAVWNQLDNLKEQKVGQLFKFSKTRLSTLQDLQQLGSIPLPRYKDSKGKPCDWSNQTAQHLTGKEDLDLLLDRPKTRPLIKSLIEPNEEIVIIVAKDNVLGEEVVVDGLHRTAALYYLVTNQPAAAKAILGSKNGVHILSMESNAASVVFGSDFIRFL